MVANATHDLLRDGTAPDGDGIVQRISCARNEISRRRVRCIGRAAVDTLCRAARHGDRVSLDLCLIFRECTAQDLCHAARTAKGDRVSAQLSLAFAVCTDNFCRRTIGEDNFISRHLRRAGRVVKIAARDIPRRCAALEVHLVVRDRPLAKGIAAVEQAGRAVLHVGGVVVNCTRVVLGTRHAAVDLLHEICCVREIDGDRVPRDIARRALVPAAIGILRFVRAVYTRHGQLIAGRRMSLIGNTAVDRLVPRRRRTIIGDAAILKAVDDPFDRLRRGFIRIRHQPALVSIRRGKAAICIIVEMQVVRPGTL